MSNRSKAFYRARHLRRHPIKKVRNLSQIGVITWGAGLNSEHWLLEARLLDGLFVICRKGYAMLFTVVVEKPAKKSVS